MDRSNSDKSFGHFSGLFNDDLEVNQNTDDIDSNQDLFIDVLDDFRQKWKTELSDNKNANNFETDFKDTDQSLNSLTGIEMEAMQLFKKGVILEQNGKLYDAVAYYRRATQLVPDIEFKMYKFEAQLYSNEENISNNTNDENNDNNESAENNNLDEFENDCDLISRFLQTNSDGLGNVFLCSPQLASIKTHFSSLPFEVVLYIIKWIVSNELDLRSLEMFGEVCRGFYIASRDSEIWRLSCYKTWGSSSSSVISHYGNNWRHMFVERVRPNFNGTYISRTTYIRQGEASFQDLHYRPCYLVEYYRYVRFFPDGHVLMLTTPDDPRRSLPSLRHRKPKNNNVLTGHYRINGSAVTLVLKREYVSDGSQLNRKYKTKSRDKSLSSQTFHISFDVKTVKKRGNCQLCWTYYAVHNRRPNSQETITAFELTQNRFPPLWFSRVKSYVSESEYRLM